MSCLDVARSEMLGKRSANGVESFPELVVWRSEVWYRIVSSGLLSQGSTVAGGEWTWTIEGLE